MDSSSLDAPARGAIHWMVKLCSGGASDADRQAFEAWRKADPQNAAAWGHLESTTNTIRDPLSRGLSAAQIHALASPPPQPARRALLQGVMGLTTLAVAGVSLDRFVPLAELTADLSTRTAQRRQELLADGTRLMLNARTAVDVRLGEGRRELSLRAGLVNADVMDPQVRPLHLLGSAGSAQVVAELSDGGCNMASEPSLCRIDVTRGQAVVKIDRQALRLEAGDSVEVGTTGVQRFRTDVRAALSWREGNLMVHDETLTTVVRMLRPYWPGLLQLDPAVAGLRVTGVFPLAETRRALRSLALTLPIRVVQRAGYWITLDRPA